MENRESMQSRPSWRPGQLRSGSTSRSPVRKPKSVDDRTESIENDSGSGVEDEQEHEDYTGNEYHSISFGALAEAQSEFLGSKQIHPAEQNKINTEKVQILRDRLAELKKIQEKPSTHPEEQQKSTDHRNSKHAPMEQSSKYAVSRKRPVFELSNSQYKSRDPRFSSVSGQVDEKVIQKNYAFLKDYQNQETLELKAAWKKTKDPNAKERLERQIVAMQNKMKSEKDKEREKGVLREHRRREKDAVKQGKKPFYLKKSEQKRLALTEKFQDMGAKERDRAIQRRRRKESQRERRARPLDRKIPSAE